MLAAIVLVAFVTGSGSPLNDQRSNGGDQQIQEDAKGNIPHAVAGGDGSGRLQPNKADFLRVDAPAYKKKANDE